MSSKNIVVFGSGYIANEYLKILKDIGCSVYVIGRNEQKAKDLAAQFGFSGYGGGVKALDQLKPNEMDLVINAVAVESLKEVTLGCLEKGFKNLLVEKPGALNLTELLEVKNALPEDGNLRIACNRRFYSSVQALQECIKKDGGMLGCFFDFTDREKDILNHPGDKSVIKYWGLANSIHVIDLAYYLIGMPKNFHVLRSGHWDVHPTGHSFAGCGETEQCLFSYFASWAGGGRWNVEIATPKGRYKLSPLEELQFCRKNQFAWEKIDIDDKIDQEYKPGMYAMVNACLENESAHRLPDLNEQIQMAEVINQMFGYES